MQQCSPPDIPRVSHAALQPLGTATIGIRTRDTPNPRASEVLVKIIATGICASDVVLSRRPPGSALQMKVATGGHEGAGQIAALGPHVNGTRWQVGDRVAVRWVHRVCNDCELCQGGNEHRCPGRLISGKDVNGTFAEYMLAESTCLARLPDEVDYINAAPILCTGVTIYRALKNADLTPGNWVAIVGAGGGLGHLGIQYARAMGLNVVALDKNRREFCLEMGARVYLDVADPGDTVARVVDATQGGVHGVIVLASSSKAYSDAGRYLRAEGKLVCVALSSESLVLTPSDLIFKGIRVIGSSTGSIRDTEEALGFVASGQVKPRVDVRKFEITRALDDLESGKITGKVVLSMC